MKLKLRESVEPPPPIEAAQIAALKLELFSGKYLNIWCVFGHIKDGHFEEYSDGLTKQRIEPLWVKLEDGCHPLVPESPRSLRRCVGCGKWWKLETVCSHCGFKTEPYDGFSRAIPKELLEQFMEAIYNFISTEDVPDPITGEERKILDGKMVD